MQSRRTLSCKAWRTLSCKAGGLSLAKQEDSLLQSRRDHTLFGLTKEEEQVDSEGLQREKIVLFFKKRKVKKEIKKPCLTFSSLFAVYFATQNVSKIDSKKGGKREENRQQKGRKIDHQKV